MYLKSKRNLLTVILTVLFAVAVALGVSFALPKNEVKTAHAALPSVTATVKNIAVYHFNAAKTPSSDVAFMDCSSGTSQHISLSAVDNCVTISETSSSYDDNAGYMEFYVEITVPAKLEYELTYDFSLSIQNVGVNAASCLGNGNAVAGGKCVGASSALFKLHDINGDDKSSNGVVFYVGTPNVCSEYIGHARSNFGTDKCGDTHTSSVSETFTFKNETLNDKTFRRKYGVSLHSYSSTSMEIHKFVSSLTVNTTVNSCKVYSPTAPTTSDTYTGSTLSFDMVYNPAYVVPTAVTGVDPAGNALATPIALTDIDTTACQFKPTLAGTYTVTFGISPSAALDGITWADGEPTSPTLTFTVKRKPIAVPANTPETYVYSGAVQAISYTHDYLKYLTVTPSDSAVTFALGSDTDGTFNGIKDAGEYTVTFGLNDINYEWNAADTTGDKTIKVKMKPKTLEFDYKLNGSTDFTNLTTNSTGNITASYTTAGSPAASEAPKLKFSYEFGGVRKTIATDEISNLTKDITTLEGTNNKFSSGTYKLIMELPSGEAVNKNYTLGASKEKSFTVGAGAVDLSALGIAYTKTSTGNTKDAIPDGGLSYSYDADTKTAEEYKFYLDFSALSYLTDDGYTYRYDGSTTVVNGYSKAGTAKVEVKIKLSDPTDANHSLPATFATAGTPFDSYTNNNDGTATLTFTVVIEKAVTTLTGEDIPLQYWFADDPTKKNYDSENPPECKDGIPVYVEWTGVKPHGVKEVVFDSTPAQEVSAGNYRIDATVTLDDNYKTSSGGNTMRVQIPWTLAKQIIKLDWTDKQIDKPGLAPHFVKNLGNLTDGQKAVVKYVYYLDVGGSPDSTPLTEAQFDALCTNDRYTDPKWLWVEAVIDTTVTGYEKFAFEDDPVKNPVRFKLGRNMTLVEATKSPEWDNLTYGGGLDKANAFTFTDKSTGLPWNSIFYELHVYKDGVDLGLLEAFDFSKADAGDDYTVEVVMKPAAINGDGEDIYAIDIGKSIPFEIKPKAIDLPTLGDITFTGGEHNIKDYLSGETWKTYGPAGKNVIQLGGDFEGIRNVGASDYVVTLTLTDANYCWSYGATANTVGFKVLSSTDYSVDGTAQQANYSWNISPLVVDTTNLWNKGNKGASLNLPQNVKDLIAGGTLELGYKYYDSEGNFVESPEIKGGRSFKVEAVFGGDDAIRNVQFKTGDNTVGNTSPAINYTVPQSGAAAFFGNALSFLKNNWWWLLIALAVLIFLIILIVVLVKRSKNKEAREEKKRQKEEEKRRREEEREAEKERQRAELELAKAKQEAELAKMKAEAAAAAGIGAAGVAMAQPQQVQQPVQQAQPQYTADANALARLEAEMAALRAENKEMHRQQGNNNVMPMAQPMMMQMPMQQPMMMQMPMQQPMMQMPMQMPGYGPMPQQYSGGGADNGVLARVEAQLNALQAQQRAKDEAEHRAEMSAMRAEMRATKEAEQTAELAALRTQMQYGGATQPQGYNVPVIQQLPAQANNNANSPNAMDMLGALVVSALKNIAEPKSSESKAIEQRVVEIEPPTGVNTPTVYPPDAVVTTTTRVDTTKPQNQTRSRDDGRLFDIDGFYDTFDENK